MQSGINGRRTTGAAEVELEEAAAVAQSQGAAAELDELDEAGAASAGTSWGIWLP